MHKLFLSIVLLPVIVLPSSAQSITFGGTVKDSAAAAAIDSVRIDIRSVAEPGKIYTVYTAPDGAWSFTINTVAVGREETVPISFDLRQNFPNPFNPSTTISFSIPGTGQAVLLVHNVLGQLIDRQTYDLSPGRYSVPWNGAGAAGTYFYTLHFGGRSITGKMIQTDGGQTGKFGGLTQNGGYAATLRKSTISDYIIRASRVGYEPDSINAPAMDNPSLNFSLSTVHHRALVFDLHNDVAELMVGGYQLGVRHTTNHSDIPRFRDGGVDAQMMVLWPDPSDFPATAYQRTIQMYDTCMAQIGRNAAAITKATSLSEIHSAHAEGKIAAVLCVEGGHAIQEDLGKLIDFYQRGARYLTITWNNSIAWATSAADAQSTTKGLSDFGKQVITTMDSLGMIIDVSHTGIKTIEDILATTKNPIIASHSGVRALRNHTRNLTDEQITAIAQGGGVIGVVFYTSFLSTASRTTVTIDTVIKHIDYIKNLVGIDHIAIGSDYDGGITTPVGLETVAKLGNLTMALLRKGYSPVDVRKILGENYLRVFSEVCGD